MDEKERTAALAHELIGRFVCLADARKLRGPGEDLARQLETPLREALGADIESLVALDDDGFWRLLASGYSSPEDLLQALAEQCSGQPSGADRLVSVLWLPVLGVEIVLTNENGFRDELALSSSGWPNAVVVRQLRATDPIRCPLCGEAVDDNQCANGHRIERFDLVGIVPGATGRISCNALATVTSFDSVVSYRALAKYSPA